MKTPHDAKVEEKQTKHTNRYDKLDNIFRSSKDKSNWFEVINPRYKHHNVEYGKSITITNPLLSKEFIEKAESDRKIINEFMRCALKTKNDIAMDVINKRPNVEVR